MARRISYSTRQLIKYGARSNLVSGGLERINANTKKNTPVKIDELRSIGALSKPVWESLFCQTNYYLCTHFLNEVSVEE